MYSIEPGRPHGTVRQRRPINHMGRSGASNDRLLVQAEGGLGAHGLERIQGMTKEGG